MSNMIEIKTEEWNGNNIRFVFLDNEWQAVLKDICDALGLKTKETLRVLREEYSKGVGSTHLLSEETNNPIDDLLSKIPLDTNGGEQEVYVCKEEALYEIIFKSRKQEAKEFKRWVFKMIKELRTASGLEGFEVFKMMDKEHQKYCHSILSQANAGKIDYIKSNQIANKAISTHYGFEKSLKKDEMSADMIKDREIAMEEVAKLMSLKLSGYDVDVKNMVYSKWS